MTRLKTPRVLWAISIAVGSWFAGWIAGLTGTHPGALGGLCAGVIVTMVTAILIAIVFVVDDLLVERANRPAPKHARRPRR